MSDITGRSSGVTFASLNGTRLPVPLHALTGDQRYNLALLVKNRSNPAYVAAQKAADDMATRLGVEMSHFVPEIPDDLGQQTELMRSVIESEKYDGLIFTPVDAEAQVPLVRMANQAGLPLHNFSNRIAAGEVVTFVGGDDVEVGRQIIAWLAAACQGRARLLLIDGAPATPTARDRMTGIRRELRGHPGLAVQGEAPAYYHRDQAAEVTSRLLREHPGTDAIVALNDEMALGAAQAVEAAGRRGEIRITGVNGTPEGLAALRDGTIAATVDYALYSIAQLSVELSVRHLNGERLPNQSILLPTPVIDGSNVREAIRERQGWGIM